MKLLAAALIAVLVLLQYRIWISNDGVRAVYRLERAVAAQEKLNARLTRRNARTSRMPPAPHHRRVCRKIASTSSSSASQRHIGCAQARARGNAASPR